LLLGVRKKFLVLMIYEIEMLELVISTLN